MKRKKKHSLTVGWGGRVDKDEKEDKNKMKKNAKMQSAGWENKNKKGVQLGREVGEEREGRRNKRGQFRNVKCCISKNGVANSN